MFTFSINYPLFAYRAGNFTQKDGTKGAYVICRECDNQPEGLERPSKSRKPIKFWLEDLPEGVTNESYIVFSEILGGEWKSVPQVNEQGERMKDRFGHDIYNDELCLVVNGLKAFVKPEEPKKEKKGA